ncbi:conserved hypothetical protein [Rubrivivax sp. A210]|uniref:LemA family protein n=1 Tax=Rubrivivax sp. A210 TaxID=2772301 RepID=UPI001918E09B|nr:LemA family protein [Rubrivivax sp. A210]CAD5371803.1 conserved hypothetical protein [Rubrivivax sp. A210]
MNAEQIAVLGFAAVLLFWMVGGYNRLMAQRNGIAQAWQRVAEALQQRATAAPLADALALPLAAEAGALQAWRAALSTAERAAASLGDKPVLQDRAAAWLAAEAALAAASSRVFALLDQQSELARSDTVAPLVAAWRDAQQRLPFARQFFNDAVAAHNAALEVFPTRLLARLCGFKPAGRI